MPSQEVTILCSGIRFMHYVPSTLSLCSVAALSYPVSQCSFLVFLRCLPGWPTIAYPCSMRWARYSRGGVALAEELEFYRSRGETFEGEI
jgi:hypothetical protein